MYHPDLRPSPTLAYVIGVVLGDGSVSKSGGSYHISLTVKDFSFACSFSNALRTLGLNPFEFQKIGSIYNETGVYHKVEAKSKILYALLKEAKSNLSSIEPYLKSDELKIAFLKGFYESEGSLSFRTDGVRPKRYPMLQLYNRDKKKLNLVFAFLKCLGFSPKLYFYEWSNYGRVSITKGIDVYRFLGMTNPCIRNMTALKRKIGILDS